jgi:serine/threonine protein kinase
MGTLNDWEKVMLEPLGSGGQSEVFLVRKPERRAGRQASLKILRDLSGQGLNDEKSARPYSVATLDIAREEYPSELGALKVFKPRAAGPHADQQALGRLRSEIAVLERKSPGLLKLLDSNESEGWMVTEYCYRGTLDGHLHVYKGNVKLALKAFRSLVHTTAALHKDLIVHRDIKPQNIFLGNTDELILGDFGIVFLPNQPQRLTVTGESVGPHDYMPPWAFLGERLETVDPNFDVYMLGKVLWCMVAGRLRLPREYHRDPRFNLTEFYPTDPHMHVVNKILDKCLVERPEDCLGSAADLVPMVDAFLSMIGRDGQLLNADVPRPCRVCGQGFYRVENGAVSEGNLQVWITGNESKLLHVRLFFCDACGHAQVFKVGERLGRP